MTLNKILTAIICLSLSSCANRNLQNGNSSTLDSVVTPLYVTEPVEFDTDDPAIWVNPMDPTQSLIIGTDKDENGGLYVYDLQGKIIKEKTVKNLKRPNNVDVAYGLKLGGKSVDVAVVTERFTHKLRIFSLPNMKSIDNGGIPVFVGETSRENLCDCR
jgi:3-phytase